MATRFYLPRGGSVPNISPLMYANNWGGQTRNNMATTKQNTALGTLAAPMGGNGYSGGNTVGLAQFVGPSLPAQTINGTVSLVLKTSESITPYGGSPAYNPACTNVNIRVCSPTGIILATLFSDIALYITTANTYGQGWANTLQTRIVPALPIGSYTCADGDRLVVTIGGRVDGYDYHTLTEIFGDPSATVDHTLVAGQTMVGVPWIEFSQDLFPVTPPKAGSAAFNALWSTSATGKTSPKGSAVVSMSWAISAIGKSIRKGAASVNTMWSTTVIGKSFRKGASSVDVLWSALVIGKADYKGSAVANTIWTINADGKADHKGSSVVDSLWVVTADGKRVPKGSVVFETVWVVTADGKFYPKGSAIANSEWSIGVDGKSIYKGLSVFRFVFTTSALGTNAGPHNITIMVALLPRRWSTQLLPKRWLGSIQPERRWKGHLL